MNTQPDAMYRATDTELLMRFVKAKDEKCFETLVSRHSNLVYQVCRTVLLNHADAEDAFQATFVILIRKAKCLLKVNSLPAWLYKVAHRIAVRANQSKRKRNHTSLTTDANSEHDPSAEIDQFHQISKKEVLGRVFDELALLPTKYKDVLVECYLQGKSYREVADATDSTETVIKGRVAQAKKTLRQRLLKRGIALSFVLVMLEQIRSVSVASSLIHATKAASLASLISESTTKVPAAIQSLSKIGIQRMSMQLLTKPLSLVVIALFATVVPISWMLNQPVQGQEGGLAIQDGPKQEQTDTVFRAKSVEPKQDSKKSSPKRINQDPFAGGGGSGASTGQGDPFGDSPGDDPFGKSSSRDPFGGGPRPKKRVRPSTSNFATGEAAEKKIDLALENTASFEFIDTPLVDVADQISDFYDIAVHIDKRAIEDAGYDADLPFTGNGKKRTLRSALKFLFNEYDFAFIIKNETLIITTEDAIASNPQDYLVSKLYDVTDLVSKDPASIITTIQQGIDADSWFDTAGGYGAMNVIELGEKSVLAISHTSEHHHQIGELLENLRKLQKTN